MNIPATVITAVLCFGITALLGFVAIPALRKLKFGQTILDIGPAWHKSKNGTPTMGGIMFIAGVCGRSYKGKEAAERGSEAHAEDNNAGAYHRRILYLSRYRR